MAEPYLLEVADLCLRRGGKILLDSIIWRVGAGEKWVVLGANGAGKTSLLSVITGYQMPTAGRVIVEGQRYGRSDWREVRKRIGWVSAALASELEGSEDALSVVASGCRAFLNVSGLLLEEELEKARQLLATLRMEHLSQSQWAWLSQGERQRIILARALLSSFRLLFLDEPCAGLDPVARSNFLRWLQELESGTDMPATIFVTHHVEEIPASATHALLLRGGRVLASGLLLEVLTSENLSLTFGAPVTLLRDEAGWSLRVKGERG